MHSKLTALAILAAITSTANAQECLTPIVDGLTQNSEGWAFNDLVKHDQKVFFGHLALHAYNPASDQVELVSDFSLRSGGSQPRGLLSAGDQLYFSGTGLPDETRRLHVYDSNTGLVDAVGEPAGNVISTFMYKQIDNEIYYDKFVESDIPGIISVPNLHVYNSVSGTESLVTQISAGSAGMTILPSNESIYIAGRDRRIATSPFGLHQYNTETGETETLLENVSGSLVEFESKLYFNGYDADVGFELTSYDPVSQTTTIHSDINPGSGSSTPQWLTVFEDKLFFGARDGDGVYGLYQYDSANGVSPVGELRVNSMIVSADSLFINAQGYNLSLIHI